MSYRVTLHPDAEAELEEAYAYIAEDSPTNAGRWKAGLLEKVASLKEIPERCPIAPEAEFLGEPVRHLIHGNYRLLFVIEDSEVVLLHVRHAAHRYLGED